MMISFSAFYSRIFLCRTLHGHLALPKGLAPSPKSDEGKLMDLLRKCRDGQKAPPELLMKRMKNGNYGLSGLRINDFLEAYDFNNAKSLIKATSASLGDFTLSAEYETALLNADKILQWIATEKPSTKSYVEAIPKSILNDLQQSKRNGKITTTFLCRCYLFSLALFDANPQMLTKIFGEIFCEDAPSCQKAFDRIIRRAIKTSGVTIEAFSEKMYKSQTPRKAFETALRNPNRIIQQRFITRLAETYYDNCFNQTHKREGLREYISTLWNFVVQSSVCLDRMGERLKFDFRAEARKNYKEYLKCAETVYSDFFQK